MVVTFYSFKGGVGRSMAMANIGHVLAQLGYRVLLCDWDLEAPGLERYLAEERADWEALEAAPGLVDLLREYKELLASTAADSEPETPASDDTFCRVGDLRLRRPSSYARDAFINAPGTLRLLTAGARGADYVAYADTVQNFDWTEFYERWAGGAYMDFLKRDLSKSAAAAAAHELPDERIPPGAADIVLVDSRTGVTEYGGVATHHLADLVVLLSGANGQNLQGTRRMADALGRQLVADNERPVPVLPVRARIETAELQLLNDFRERFDATFTNHLPPAVGQPAAFFEASEIPYVPYYSFEERLITREGTRGREPKLYKAYRCIADAIVTWGTKNQLIERLPASEVQGSAIPHTAVATRSFGLLIVRAAFVDKAWADGVVHALAGAGLNVSTDPLGAPAAPHAEPAGVLILIGPTTPDRWIRAECEQALKRHVLRPDLRLVPAVYADTDVARTPYINRARIVRITEGREAAEAILSELAIRGTVDGEAPNVNPFPGVQPFTEEDARFFFGRDTEIARVEASLTREGTTWLRIEGPTGAGKSSFLQAGVIPAIRRVIYSRVLRTPLVANCRLSGDALESLAAPLAGATGRTTNEIDAALRRTDAGLRELAAEAAKAGNLLVLVIDQLEEAAWSDAMGAPSLDAQLAAALAATDAPFVLVTAVRSEWNEAVSRRLPVLHQSHPGVTDAGNRRQEIACRIDAPTRGQMADIMTAPARLAGLEWQRGLLERITDDVDTDQVSLALVAALLNHLWRHRAERQLTFAAYREFGSPAQHLAKVLEERIHEWPAADQARAKWLLLSLVSTGGGRTTRRLVPRRDALTAAGGDARASDILSDLMRAPGVIRMDGSDRLELAHDALLQESKTLQAWIESERRRLGLRDELEAFLASSGASGTGQELPRGAQLAYFKEAAPLSTGATEFLNRARASERRRRTWRNLSIAAALVVLVLVGVGSFLLLSDTRQAQATQLAVESQRVGDDKPLRSLSLAVRAANLAQTTESEAALRRVLGSTYPRTVVHHDGAIVDVAFSTDGSRLVTASVDGTAGLWDARTGRLLSKLQHGQPVRATSILPDGRIATLTEDVCRIWTASGAQALEFRRKGGDLIQLATSRDGNLVAALDLRDKVPVWDLRGGPTRFLQASGATTIDFRPDNTLLVATASGEIVDEDPLTGKTIGESLHLAGVSPFGAALSQDGKVFAAAGTDGAFVWPSFDTSTKRIQLDGSSKQPVSSLILSRDGRWVVGVARGYARVWDARTGREERAVGEGVVIASLSPDGETIAVARSDGLVQIWNRGTTELKKTLRFHTGFVRQLRFSADGGSLVSAGDDGAAIWDLLAAPPDTAAMSFSALRSATAALLPAGVSFDPNGQIIER